jgi:hypothetical protein
VNETELNHDVQEQVGDFAKQILGILLDTVYLTVWVCAQWITAKVVANLELSGMDSWMLLIFQIIFAVSTLAVVVMWLYKDLTITWWRVRRRVMQEQLQVKLDD